MNLIALGINHNSAAVEVRERVAFAPEQVSEALVDACDLAGLEEVVILSTCNRTELYAIVPEGSSPGDKATALIDWVVNYHHLSASELHRCAYHYEGAQACGTWCRSPAASTPWCWESRKSSGSSSQPSPSRQRRAQ